MQETTNKKLKKIDLTDAPPDITAINPNWDTIDTELQTGTNHINNNAVHVTSADKTSWNSKANGSHSHTTVLYNNANGTNSGFTLSQTAANFAYMRIYYAYNDGAGRRVGSVDVANPNSSYPLLFTFEHDASTMYIKLARLFISGTSVTFAASGHAWLTPTPTVGINATTKPIKVTKVIAWN